MENGFLLTLITYLHRGQYTKKLPQQPSLSENSSSLQKKKKKRAQCKYQENIDSHVIYDVRHRKKTTEKDAVINILSILRRVSQSLELYLTCDVHNE